MTGLNRQRVANHHHISVALSGGGTKATIFVRTPNGNAKQSSIEIETLLDGGMSEGEALDYVARVVEIGILSSTEFGNG